MTYFTEFFLLKRQAEAVLQKGSKCQQQQQWYVRFLDDLNKMNLAFGLRKWNWRRLWKIIVEHATKSIDVRMGMTLFTCKKPKVTYQIMKFSITKSFHSHCHQSYGLMFDALVRVHFVRRFPHWSIHFLFYEINDISQIIINAGWFLNDLTRRHMFWGPQHESK